MDIKVNSTIHKGMPYRFYHGKTGVVWNVTKRAVGVEVNKVHREKVLKKQIHVRIEHVGERGWVHFRCEDGAGLGCRGQRGGGEQRRRRISRVILGLPYSSLDSPFFLRYLIPPLTEA